MDYFGFAISKVWDFSLFRTSSLLIAFCFGILWECRGRRRWRRARLGMFPRGRGLLLLGRSSIGDGLGYPLRAGVRRTAGNG